MKKITIILLSAIIMVAINTTTVNASENEITYFTNMNGVKLTKKQYENLRKGFSHDTINTMSEEMINRIKDDENIKTVSTTKYIKTSTKYSNGIAVSAYDEEVTLKQYINSSNTFASRAVETKAAPRDYVETNYKKITLEISYGASINEKYVTLTTVWKTIPATKSYDVLAIAPGVTAGSFNFSGHRSGYQKYDGSTINYSANSGNWKILNSNTMWKKGLGLSQNIVDSTSSSLENSITVLFITYSNPFPVRASYQHATSDVTLSQSQNYTLGIDGMGGLIKFASSVASKYDNTRGLYAIFDYLNV